MWDNGIVAYQASTQREFNRPVCGFYGSFVNFIQLIPCLLQIEHLYNMCEYRLETGPHFKVSLQHVQLSLLTNVSFTLDTVRCPTGHYTQMFLACDLQAGCFLDQDWSASSSEESWDFLPFSRCNVPELTSLPPSFVCASVTQWVPYSLVCDHREDCEDNSDENFCQFPSCLLSMSLCGNSKQCYVLKKECDRVHDCLNSADEMQCTDRQLDPSLSLALPVIQPPPPVMVTLDGQGMYKVESLGTQPCPPTHFWCLSDDCCLPVFVLCNGIDDCPRREDEQNCNRNDLCPGYYRCRSSSICLHPSQVCDGMVQCPQRDDEQWCAMACPQQCQCWGLAFACAQTFSAGTLPDLRYIDAQGSGMALSDFAYSSMVIHLSLAHCSLTHLDEIILNNLHSLDLSNNFLHSFSLTHFVYFPRLKMLFLSGNQFPVQFQSTYTNTTIMSLEFLDLSLIEFPVLNTNSIHQFVRLKTLNLSGCQVNQIDDEGFNLFKNLQALDMRGCPLLHFPWNGLKKLASLKSVYADNYKLCCEAMLPDGFNNNNCYAPFDEVSSCKALLRSDVYRIFLSLSAAMALIGNLVTFSFRLLRQGKEASGFSVFVTNLCTADFLMGVYLLIIGVADRLYLGTYLWKDRNWRHSVACTLAGFLSLISSEVSVFMICLITIDRLLVLRFPFSQLRFNSRVAWTVCIVLWSASLLLASVPLFPHSIFRDFYNQFSICIPLPITRKNFQGDAFAFGIMIVLNFILFMMIAAGQGLIFLTIRANAMSASKTDRQSQDLTIARRLITIAISDFLCWFPIGLLGFLAAQGIPISGEVNVAMAILVLPINSVINPFLYTLNMIMEQRQKAREARLLKWLEISRAKLQ